jgi:hypothetical protein
MSLRTLLLVVLAICVWLAVAVRPARQQRDAVAALLRHDLSIHYDYEYDAIPAGDRERGGITWYWLLGRKNLKPKPGEPEWVRRLVGDDYLHRVVAVTLPSDEPEAIDAVLPHLKRLPHLSEVFLHAPSCGMALGDSVSAQEKLDRELPHVKVILYSIPIVG